MAVLPQPRRVRAALTKRARALTTAQALFELATLAELQVLLLEAMETRPEPRARWFADTIYDSICPPDGVRLYGPAGLGGEAMTQALCACSLATETALRELQRAGHLAGQPREDGCPSPLELWRLAPISTGSRPSRTRRR